MEQQVQADLAADDQSNRADDGDMPGQPVGDEQADATNLAGLEGAALAHLWFVMTHPFEDRNGRIARAIADMALARSERTPMSSQIRIERKAYDETLERTQKGNLDVTEWLA